MMRIWDADLLTKEEKGYVTNGLVLWYDGINNTRHGHDASSTKWEDLSGNGYDATITRPSDRLQKDFYFFNGNFQYTPIVLQNFGEQKVTYEVVVYFYRTDPTYNEAILTHNPVVSNQGQAAFFMRLQTSDGIVTGSNVPSMVVSPNTASQFIQRPSTLSVVYTDSQVVYANAIVQSGTTATYSTFKRNTDLILGARMTTEDQSSYSGTQSLYGRMYSVRIYDRALSAREIAQNYAVDKKRFGSGVNS